MSEDCGKITFIVGASYDYEYTHKIPDSAVSLLQFNINVPYVCGEECAEKICVWWNLDCSKTCKTWGISYCCAWNSNCKEEICVLYEPKWCSQKVPIWPETMLRVGDDAIMLIKFTTNTSSASFSKSFNNLGELVFGFKQGKLGLFIEDVKVLQLDLKKYSATITTSGAINFYYDAYVYVYHWEGLEQTYKISVGFQLCPYLLTVSFLMKLSVSTVYYGVKYDVRKEIPVPLPL